MLKMLYVPSGVKNIKDRPKVYFCCHPEDFDFCFGVISKDILSKQKCTIWYAEDLTARREREYLEDLKQMQLFVLPVTSRLLYKDSFALSVEFSFAVENHIPVLPIMMESFLEEDFNKKCGDLQFLDKFSNDSTAISYDEKLEKFLKDVLVGDEQAKKIRDAFDAYIFLSYRKKDRYEAQKLMKLIHKNDFCRDIAIWYDEFLTPGEDFNENIADALNKSRLFALAVTPNLVNERNYVQTTEYPMAKEAGKVILPVELVETDRELLQSFFADIPPAVNVKDEYAFVSILRYAVNFGLIEERERTPAHNFLIGLAYLGGIDVEVDFEKALELITSSAEAGIVEAVDKLVQMYRTGMGVKREYYTAIKWHEKKCELLKIEYKENPSLDLLNQLCTEYIVCGDYYSEISLFSEAVEKYSEIFFLVVSNNFTDEDHILTRYMAVSYERIGTVRMRSMDYSAAEINYRKSMGLSERLVYEFGMVDLQRDLAVCYYKMGVAFAGLKKLQEAMIYYKKAYDADSALSKNTEDSHILGALSWDCTGIAGILEKQGDLQGALVYYMKALEIRERLYSESNSVQNSMDLSICYNDFGCILANQERLKEAKEYCNKAIVISENLAEETGMMRIRQNLSQQYVDMGGILSKEGNLRGACEYYNKALDIRVKLSEEAPTAYNQEMLAYACCDVASVYPEKAKTYLDVALNVFENLCVKYPANKERYMNNIRLIKSIIGNM